MPERAARIVVAGDVAVDWLQWPVAPQDGLEEEGPPRPNWALYPGLRMSAWPGGALLLARLVGAATGASIASHRLEDLRNIPPEEVVHSVSMLGRVPYSCREKDARNLVYRVDHFCGYSGPAEGAVRPLPVIDDNPDAEIVVLDDAGNGFRDDESVWPAALTASDGKPLVVLKMSRPLATGRLWDLVTGAHAERLVVVVSANALREWGVNISRRLSWERTAQDLAWQMVSNRALAPLAACSNLIVRFGLDGALHCTRRGGVAESRLFYDPSVVEDGFLDGCPGTMQGIESAFVAALVARIAREGLGAAGQGVRDGIQSSRRLVLRGFGRPPAPPSVPGEEIFRGSADEDPFIADVLVPSPGAPGDEPRPVWTILEDLTKAHLETVACNTVVRGTDPRLRCVPAARFRRLQTVDRTEIESFHSIRNLMVEYLAAGKARRPLSIAVFGPPGSGKTFGITEIASTIAPGQVEELEFNLSQFASTADLVGAFHKVRDIVLGGKLALVFFDEFDSPFGGELGWLKWFLAPMQAGEFRDGETMHPIGKAIFVFAGGTSHTFEEFSRERLEGEGGEGARERFRAAKGPDFVSRLRGTVNILGINPSHPGDRFFMIRRAMLLRSLLEKRARGIFDGSGRARIDPGVLRAMIKVPEYKHGARSMAAIVEMSALAGRRKLEQAALPPEQQLELQVDAATFSRLVLRDVLFGDALDKLARAIHDKYRQDQQGKRPADDPVMRPWETLPEEYRESNRQQANQIPEKLQAAGYGFAPVSGRPAGDFAFSDKEVEFLAQMEHKRWMAEKTQVGWTYAGARDNEKKLHPCLVPWAELPPEEQDKDRATVRAIPCLLGDAGFGIYPLD